MKSALVFFLSLCFLILGKHDTAFAKSSKTGAPSLSAYTAEKASQLMKTQLSEKKEELISVEDEAKILHSIKKTCNQSGSLSCPAIQPIPKIARTFVPNVYRFAGIYPILLPISTSCKEC